HETLRGHEGTAWSAAFSPDGTRIVTASSDNTARVWRQTPCDDSFNAAFTSAEGDDTRRLWTLSPTAGLCGLALGDVAASVRVPTRDAPQAGAFVSMESAPRALVGFADGSADLIDLASGEIVATFVGHTQAITHIEVDLEGSRAVIGAQDGSVQIVSLPDRSGPLLAGMTRRAMDAATTLSSLHEDTLNWIAPRVPPPDKSGVQKGFVRVDGSTGTLSDSPRLALVIGNADYAAEIGTLRNPLNDASAVRAALEEVGFNVTLVLDASRDQLLSEISRFRNALDAEGPDAVGFLYFSGHGISINDRNLILPSDASVGTQTAALATSIAIGDLVETLRSSTAGLIVLAVDACRNAPGLSVPNARSPSTGVTKSIEGGFSNAGIEDLFAGNQEDDRLLIAFATEPGDVAADGDAISPFAAAMLEHIPAAGLRIEQTFEQVRQSTIEFTAGAQRPSLHYGDLRELCLRYCASDLVAADFPRNYIRSATEADLGLPDALFGEDRREARLNLANLLERKADPLLNWAFVQDANRAGPNAYRYQLGVALALGVQGPPIPMHDRTASAGLLRSWRESTPDPTLQTAVEDALAVVENRAATPVGLPEIAFFNPDEVSFLTLKSSRNVGDEEWETFIRSFSIVQHFDGGHSDDPNDPGGATNMGVTQGVYDD
ncbi:MAG: caspase family protein, partial [Pseudomonadota bacterium]